MFNNMKSLFKKKQSHENENLHTEDLMKKLYEQNELLINQFRKELEERAYQCRNTLLMKNL